MLISGVVFGKMAGGIVSDKLGLLRTSVVSLGLATVCFFLSNQPMIGVLGVFFFNMTMPITLGEAARQLHKTKGFAFGLLTFALFLGYLPVEASFTSNLQNTISYAVLSFVSLVILYFGLKKGSSCNGNA